MPRNAGTAYNEGALLTNGGEEWPAPLGASEVA
jgi:hypothetical protein